MAIEIYLGNPPQHVIDWIKSHSQPASHEETWYKYDGDTEWRTVSISGTISGNSDEETPTEQIPNVCNVVELEIGTDVTSIGYEAFINCSGLTSVTIGNSVTSIGEWAFAYCSGLTSVTIGNGVTSIGSDAFSGCNNALFDTATIPGVKLVDGWAVGRTGSLSGNLNLTGARGIGSSVFYICSELTSVTIPDSVTSIGYDAFNNCSGLTSVMIPDSVMSIGGGAFSDCSGLTSVTITANGGNAENVKQMMIDAGVSSDITWNMPN